MDSIKENVTTDSGGISGLFY